MEKKTILITGATNGIGKATAMAFARMGHSLILHGRNEEKTRACVDEIIRETDNRRIDYVLADMLRLNSVREMAEAVKQRYKVLDVLINNAGTQYGKERETTEDGNEKTMTVNVMAPALLSLALLPLLSRSPDGRIVTTSSAAYAMGGRFYPDDIQMVRHYSFTGIYGLSKLYVIWMMRGLEAVIRERGLNVKVYITHPGMVRTGLAREARNMPLIWKVIYPLFVRLMSNTMDKAISGNLLCALSENVECGTGIYYGPKGKELINDLKYTPETNQPLVWNYFKDIIKKYE